MFFLFSELINNEKIEMLSPLVLAFVGDTVYDLYVRTRLVSQTNAGVDKLHKYLLCKLQCAIAKHKKIEPPTETNVLFLNAGEILNHTPKMPKWRITKCHRL